MVAVHCAGYRYDDYDHIFVCMIRSLFSLIHSVLQVSQAILLRFASSPSKDLARCGHLTSCSMVSRSHFYTPLCRLCSIRSGSPFWLDYDYDTTLIEYPTQFCLDCLVPRRSAFWLRLYSLPRLDANTNLHIYSFLHDDLRHLWRRAYVITICIHVGESPFQLLTWASRGEAAVLSDGREVVNLVLDFLV